MSNITTAETIRRIKAWARWAQSGRTKLGFLSETPIYKMMRYKGQPTHGSGFKPEDEDPLCEEIEHIITNMPEEFSVPLVAYFYQGSVDADIASDLGIERATVNSRRMHAYTWIRAKLSTDDVAGL